MACGSRDLSDLCLFGDGQVVAKLFLLLDEERGMVIRLFVG